MRIRYYTTQTIRIFIIFNIYSVMLLYGKFMYIYLCENANTHFNNRKTASLSNENNRNQGWKKARFSNLP